MIPLFAAVVFIAGCTQSSSNGSSSAGTSSDLTGKAYSALTALGAPIECSIQQKDFETQETLDMKIYLKGQSFRSETKITGPSPTGAEDCGTLVTIFSNKVITLGCDPIIPTEECNWLTLDTSKYPEAQIDDISSSGLTPGELEGLPGTSFSCKYGSFGDDKFKATSGKTCSFDEFVLKGLTGGDLGETDTSQTG